MALFKKKQAAPVEAPVVDYTGLSEEEIARLEAEAVLAKYDKESSYRNRLPKYLSLFIAAVLVGFSIFQICTSISPIPAQLLRAYHVGIVLFLVYMLYPAK